MHLNPDIVNRPIEILIPILHTLDMQFPQVNVTIFQKSFVFVYCPYQFHYIKNTTQLWLFLTKVGGILNSLFN